MPNRMTLVVATAILVSLLVSACAPAATPAPPAPTATATLAPLDGKSLVESRCSVCHTLALVEGRRKTEEGWKDTVARMVGKGAQLDQAEQELVIGYLVETQS